MICPGCQEDVRPVAQMTAAGLVRRCPGANCGARMDVVDTDGASPLPPPVVPLRQPAIVATPSAAEPLDIVALARKRLDFVRARVAELRAFEREQAKLELILAAAGELEEPTVLVGPNGHLVATNEMSARLV